ncbi:MAG: hypothetical protein WCS43_12135 [Verrucomicrobiota bacterium]
MRSMVVADMERGAGMMVIDPHGDLFHDLLGLVPKHRMKDVVVLDPTAREHVVGLNLLECKHEDEAHFVARELGTIVQRMIIDKHGAAAAGPWMGPLFFMHMQMNMLLAMSNPDDPGTLIEFNAIFSSDDYWKRWLPLRSRDPKLVRWVEEVLPKANYLKRNSDQFCLGEWISTKFEDFVFDPRMRNIFGQKKSTLDMRSLMDDGKILLVNLAKGQLTEANSHFLGMVLLAKLQAAAMTRADSPVASRRPFYVYVDEFQAICTQNFISLLSEGRKFGLRLVLVNQFLSQIENPRIMQGVKGNVATHIAFRTGREDAEELEQVFLPAFDRLDLSNLPNWHACVRTSVNGQVTAPFLLRTMVPGAAPSDSVRERVLEESRRHYARSRAEVEEEISRSLGGNAAERVILSDYYKQQWRLIFDRRNKLLELLVGFGQSDDVYKKSLEALKEMRRDWRELSNLAEKTPWATPDNPEVDKAKEEIKKLREKIARIQEQFHAPESCQFTTAELLELIHTTLDRSVYWGLVETYLEKTVGGTSVGK